METGMSSGKNHDAHEPLRIPDWWPKAKGYTKFPTDGSLSTAAKALDGHLDALDAAMSRLESEGSVTAEDIGNWDAGQHLAGAANAAHEHIGAVYREFQRQLATVSILLVKHHQRQGDAEHAATKASRRITDGGVSSPPTTPPTQKTTRSFD
jgi:hypothetical protein